MTVPVRFGSHAAHVHKNGWLPIVPVYGKSGLERNWPMAGWDAADARGRAAGGLASSERKHRLCHGRENGRH